MRWRHHQSPRKNPENRRMIALVLRRVAGLVVTLLVVSPLIFAVMDMPPGDPASIMLGTSASPETRRRCVRARPRPAAHGALRRVAGQASLPAISGVPTRMASPSPASSSSVSPSPCRSPSSPSCSRSPSPSPSARHRRLQARRHRRCGRRCLLAGHIAVLAFLRRCC